MRLLSRVNLFFLTLALLTLLIYSITGYSLPPSNLPFGVTPVSREIYQLHMAIFWICVGIGIVVFGALFYSLYKFRKSKGAVPSKVHEHLGIEILWTVIPFVILVAMAIPATKVLINIHDTSKPDLDIKVTGYQWKWKYDYLNQDISYFSNMSTTLAQIDNQTAKNKWFLLEVDHPLVVPIHKKIRFLITSDDVIHSWWVPELGIKQDAVPGYINDNWAIIDKAGIYRGQCAELCGANHAFMPIVVKAVTEKDFKKWLRSQHAAQIKQATVSTKPISPAALLALGEKAYLKNCAACHQPNGKGLPPTFPALKGSQIVTGPVNKQIKIVLYGVKNTAMQAFGEQLDAQTLAAIITYTRSAWGNDKLNQKAQKTIVVQPSEVKREDE